MSVREFSDDAVRILARRFAAADPAWSREELASALADPADTGPGRVHFDPAAGRSVDRAALLSPDRADDLARRIVEAFPREPVDPLGTLIGYLTELRTDVIPAVPEPLATPVTTLALTERPGRAGPLAVQPWDGLARLDSVDDIAAMLDLTPAELAWFADRGSWLRARRAGPLQHYRVRRIAKRSGTRLLEIPKPRLREIQRKILHRIVSGIDPHPAAHGFRPGRDATTCAAPHAGTAVLLRLDLRDFFARCRGAQIRAIFAAVGYRPEVARTLADLCTTATPIAELSGLDPSIAGYLRGRHLPQGAPTSPALSNLVLRTVDRRIAGYARRHQLSYTRYADDLALSGDAMDTATAQWVIEQIVADAGFAVHPDKIRVMHRHQQQRLAGLVTNHRPQVSRRDYDALRALLHNAATTGAAAQNRGGHEHFRDHVLGRIAWIGASNPRRRRVLLDLAALVDWDR